MYQPGFYYPTSFSGSCGGGAENGLPTGGSTGSILIKNSDKNYDVSFQSQINYERIIELYNISSTSGTIGSKGLYIYHSKTNSLINFTINGYKHNVQSQCVRFDAKYDGIHNPLDKIAIYKIYSQSLSGYGRANDNRYITFIIYVFNGSLRFEHYGESLDFVKGLNSFNLWAQFPVDIIN